MEKTACYVCLNVSPERRVESNDNALPIPTGSLYFMRCVFPLVAEVAVTYVVRSDMRVLRPQMFACQMKVLKCAC